MADPQIQQDQSTTCEKEDETHLEQVQSSEKAGFVDFRRLIAQNRVTHLDRYIEKSDATRV